MTSWSRAWHPSAPYRAECDNVPPRRLRSLPLTAPASIFVGVPRRRADPSKLEAGRRPSALSWHGWGRWAAKISRPGRGVGHPRNRPLNWTAWPASALAPCRATRPLRGRAACRRSDPSAAIVHHPAVLQRQLRNGLLSRAFAIGLATVLAQTLLAQA